jgi:hypothetical protein
MMPPISGVHHLATPCLQRQCASQWKRWPENRITDRGDRRVRVRNVDTRHPVGTATHMGGRGALHLLRGDPAKLRIPLSDARHLVGTSFRPRLASPQHNPRGSVSTYHATAPLEKV